MFARSHEGLVFNTEGEMMHWMPLGEAEARAETAPRPHLTLWARLSRQERYQPLRTIRGPLVVCHSASS